MTGSGSVGGQLLAAMATDSEPAGASRLCRACVTVLGVDRAAITLMPKSAASQGDSWKDATLNCHDIGDPGAGQGGTERGHLELVGASDAAAARLEELQITLGEGPGIEAFAERGPVWVPDLRAHDVAARWPIFASALDREVAGSMFCFPLQVGVIQLGVLDLYRQSPGPYDSPRLSAALRIVDAVTRLLLASASDFTTGEFADLEPAPTNPQIHQAVGMVIVQLGVTAEEAFARLRAHAFAESLTLNEVAGKIVRRRLRLAPLTQEPA